MQNADLIIAIGCRVSLPTVGFDPKLFPRSAMKIVVDNDPAQLQNLTVEADLKVHTDSAVFIDQLNSRGKVSSDRWAEWRKTCQRWRARYPSVTDAHRDQTGAVNAYYFFEVLSEEMSKTDALVCDQGTAFHSFTTAFKNQKGQRAFANGGFAPTGYGLHAAIGATFSREVKTVVCVQGDGGLQMSLAALSTVAHHQPPLKLFVLNNGGHLGLKHTQTAAFDGRLVGVDTESGLPFPSASSLAAAHELPLSTIVSHDQMREVIRKVLKQPGPQVVIVKLDPMQPLLPRVVTGRDANGTRGASRSRTPSKKCRRTFPWRPSGKR